MPTHILMNAVDEQELRVAVVRDGRLEQLLHERIGDGQHLGNIYKARVANVEPSLDAAFLDLGTGKNGFIHVDEVQHEQGDRARIEKVLQPGQEILVQITKEAIKDKGPCVSTYLSIPGRYLVLMSATQIKGVSKRIEDQAVRRRLKKLLASFEPPPGFGFIVRTAGADRDEDEIRLDYEFLKRLWEEIDTRARRMRAPSCIYQEADVVIRTLRDLGTADVEAIVIDREDLYDEARAFAQVFMPEVSTRIQMHRDPLPGFTYYGIEDRLAAIADRKVELPSGGTIVIEQTEALVSIDVNSARNRGSADVETTALMTNLEAVNTIAEQLVLRDLGGLIIIDFIDMDNRDHQRMVQLALRRALAKDKARIQIGPMSRFGLIEMTRQRTRPSHTLASSMQCPYCTGTGAIKTAESFEIDCMRAVREAMSGRQLSRLDVQVPADMAISILNARHREIADLEQLHDCRISFTGDALMKAREYRLMPVARKGGGRRGGDHDRPVHPGLLAPLLVERAKALQMARDLAKMSPDQLERELAEGEVSREEEPQGADAEAKQEAPSPAARPAPAVPVGPPSIFDEAQVLRRLLFSAPIETPVSGAVAVAATTSRLAEPRANGNGTGGGGSGNGGGRGRQRRRRRR